jgi:hypothetical protein
MWNIKRMVLGVIILSFPSLGAISLLESEIQTNEEVYQITVSQLPKYTYLDFVNMAIAVIGN